MNTNAIDTNIKRSDSESHAGARAEPSFSYRSTGYSGYEDEILAVRNANRDIQQSRPYLDWRYAKHDDQGQAEVYWVDQADHAAARVVGMAALIPRSYWLDGEPDEIGVLGDISLEPALRGRGVGKALLGYVSASSREHFPRRLNFVLPTAAAQRALAAVGWRSGGELILHVLLLDPYAQLLKLLGQPRAARALTKFYGLALRAGLGPINAAGPTLEVSRNFDASFDALWATLPKRGLCLADRSARTLNWRYRDHPDHDFEVAAWRDSKALHGYLVYEVSARECFIYDVLVRSRADLRAMLKRFVREMLGRQVTLIRVMLNDSHPYRSAFRRMGFIGREAFMFQYHDPLATPEGTSQGRAALRWMLTQGDKDI